MAKHSNKRSRLIIGIAVVLVVLAVSGYLVIRYAPNNPFEKSTFLDDVGDANRY